MVVFKKMRFFVDTRDVAGGIPAGDWLEIEFTDDDDKPFTPESIIIKVDSANSYLEYSFSEGDTKTVHGRLYDIGNNTPPTGPGQEIVSENNELATKIWIRGEDNTAIARIWANRG